MEGLLSVKPIAYYEVSIHERRKSNFIKMREVKKKIKHKNVYVNVQGLKEKEKNVMKMWEMKRTWDFVTET